MPKWLWIVLGVWAGLFLLLIGGVIAVALRPTSEPVVSPLPVAAAPIVQNQPVPGAVPLGDVVKVKSYAELWWAYQRNVFEADEKYTGKVVEMPFGWSGHVQKDGAGYYVPQHIHADPPRWMEPGFRAYLSGDEIKKASAIKGEKTLFGYKCLLRGRVKGKVEVAKAHEGFMVVLVDCSAAPF